MRSTAASGLFCGEVGTSANMAEQVAPKVCPSTEREIKQNCQRQLYQNSGKQSNVYDNEVNVESRKKQLNKGRKVLWHSYVSLSGPFPRSVMVLKITVCITKVELQSLVP